MPRISVIVPVYNVEKYLNKCIDSILEQTFTDFELILIDDGSPDQCGMICDAYAAGDSRVKVIHQNNKGLSGARNTGIDQMKGDYVTFIDSDDYIHPEMLERFWRAAREQDADVCVCQFVRVTEDKTEFQTTPEMNMRAYSGREACFQLYSENGVAFTTAWGKLYRSILWNNIRYPEGKIHEDEATTYKLLYASNVVTELEDTLYFYRQNPNGIMASLSIKRYDGIEALRERMKFFKKHHETELVRLTKRLYDIARVGLLLKMREGGVYSEVPLKHRMSKIRALYVIHKYYDFPYFEWRLSQLFPCMVKPAEYIHKIFQVLSRCRTEEN